MSEDVHVTDNVVPTEPPKPTVLEPVREPDVTTSAPPSNASDWSAKCTCGWESNDIREDGNYWSQVDFPSSRTASDFFVCPKCNLVLRIYMKSMRGVK